MGMYRLGDIIRMTRKSLSITQEQLSEGICSVETLSRMETGKQTPSKETYELLMERMGRIRERAYSMLSISDFKMLEKMKLFEDYIKLFDYNQAEIVLADIKKTLGNTILDKQFLLRAENLVNYRLKRIGVDEFIDALQQAIILTIPRYGSISLSGWPLTFNEATLLVNISTGYAEKGDNHRAILILEETYNAMKQSYVDEQQRAIQQVSISYNLAKWYDEIENHGKAIEIANEGISICKKFRLGNALPYLLFCVAWSKEQLIDKGVLSPENKRECLSYYKQAYYIAAAMQQPFIEQYMEELLATNYNVSLGSYNIKAE